MNKKKAQERKASRRKVNYYLHRIYALCRKDIKVILKRIRKNRGVTNTIDTIYLHPKQDIIPTFIHECLHILYPSWSESRIIKWEEKIINTISIRQIINLLQGIAYSVIRSYGNGDND